MVMLGDRGWRVLGACVLAITAVVAEGTGPAHAQPGPTVTVTPSSVRDGQTVTITAAGFTSGLHAFLQCPASYAGTGDSYVLDTCRLLSTITDSVPAASVDALVDGLHRVKQLFG